MRGRLIGAAAGITRAMVGALAFAGAAASASCRIGTDAVPDPPLDAIEVHAILDPARITQEVLVERVQPVASGSPSVLFDPADPLGNHGGIPITDARVLLVDGVDSIALTQTRRADGTPTGVYVAQNPAGVNGPGGNGPSISILPGRRYALAVETPSGIVSGATQIPGTPSAGLVRVDTETLDVARAPVVFHWRSIPGARGYVLTVTHSAGVFVAVLPDTTAALDGTLRDPAHGLAPVLAPGFQQSVSVVAVDSAYYNWVRIDRINSAELKTNLAGGFGVFGSAIAVVARSIATTTSDTTPPNGRWTATDSASAAGSGLPVSFDTYRSDEHAGLLRLTGRYVGPSTTPQGLLGTISGDSVRIALLRNWSGADTATAVGGMIDASRGRIDFSTTRGHVGYTRRTIVP